MQDLAKLSTMASYEIDDLTESGIVLTPEEIVEINALGWAVESPESRQSLARGIPVEVAGVQLWPLTLYGQEWFDRVGCKLPGGMAKVYALAYAMAHQRDEGEPLSISGHKAWMRVMWWGSRLRCTLGELNVALAQVIQQDEEHETPPSPEQTGGMSIGDFSAFLAAACGGDPDFWERRCSLSYTYSVLDAVARQAAADGKKLASDPQIKATMSLGYRIEQIKADRMSNGPQ